MKGRKGRFITKDTKRTKNDRRPKTVFCSFFTYVFFVRFDVKSQFVLKKYVQSKQT